MVNTDTWDGRRENVMGLSFYEDFLSINNRINGIRGGHQDIMFWFGVYLYIHRT